MFHSRVDATMTGQSYRAYAESFPVLHYICADDTNKIFLSQANVSNGVSSIISHFARFGAEIQTDQIHPTGESKTEILIYSKLLIYAR